VLKEGRLIGVLLDPILILGLIQANLYLISDEILSLSFQLGYLIIFIFLVGLS